jgi:hypothetical protein
MSFHELSSVDDQDVFLDAQGQRADGSLTPSRAPLAEPPSSAAKASAFGRVAQGHQEELSSGELSSGVAHAVRMMDDRRAALDAAGDALLEALASKKPDAVESATAVERVHRTRYEDAVQHWKNLTAMSRPTPSAASVGNSIRDHQVPPAPASCAKYQGYNPLSHRTTARTDLGDLFVLLDGQFLGPDAARLRDRFCAHQVLNLFGPAVARPFVEQAASLSWSDFQTHLLETFVNTQQLQECHDVFFNMEWYGGEREGAEGFKARFLSAYEELFGDVDDFNKPVWALRVLGALPDALRRDVRSRMDTDKSNRYQQAKLAQKSASICSSLLSYNHTTDEVFSFLVVALQAPEASQKRFYRTDKEARMPWAQLAYNRRFGAAAPTVVDHRSADRRTQPMAGGPRQFSRGSATSDSDLPPATPPPCETHLIFCFSFCSRDHSAVFRMGGTHPPSSDPVQVAPVLASIYSTPRPPPRREPPRHGPTFSFQG